MHLLLTDMTEFAFIAVLPQQGKNADILKQARQARPTCPPAPEAAPPSKQLATFAGGSQARHAAPFAHERVLQLTLF